MLTITPLIWGLVLLTSWPNGCSHSSSWPYAPPRARGHISVKGKEAIVFPRWCCLGKAEAHLLFTERDEAGLLAKTEGCSQTPSSLTQQQHQQPTHPMPHGLGAAGSNSSVARGLSVASIPIPGSPLLPFQFKVFPFPPGSLRTLLLGFSGSSWLVSPPHSWQMIFLEGKSAQKSC